MINKVLPTSLRLDITLDDIDAAQIPHEKIGTPSSDPPQRPKRSHQPNGPAANLLIGGRRFHQIFLTILSLDETPAVSAALPPHQIRRESRSRPTQHCPLGAACGPA
jgi:hypothetical protein